jgi:hypothetical protein
MKSNLPNVKSNLPNAKSNVPNRRFNIPNVKSNVPNGFCSGSSRNSAGSSRNRARSTANRGRFSASCRGSTGTEPVRRAGMSFTRDASAARTPGAARPEPLRSPFPREGGPFGRRRPQQALQRALGRARLRSDLGRRSEVGQLRAVPSLRASGPGPDDRREVAIPPSSSGRFRDRSSRRPTPFAKKGRNPSGQLRAAPSSDFREVVRDIKLELRGKLGSRAVGLVKFRLKPLGESRQTKKVKREAAAQAALSSGKEPGSPPASDPAASVTPKPSPA